MWQNKNSFSPICMWVYFQTNVSLQKFQSFEIALNELLGFFVIYYVTVKILSLYWMYFQILVKVTFSVFFEDDSIYWGKKWSLSCGISLIDTSAFTECWWRHAGWFWGGNAQLNQQQQNVSRKGLTKHLSAMEENFAINTLSTLLASQKRIIYFVQ